MCDALKSFYFRLKKVNARKGIFFYLIVMERLFMKEFKRKIFTIAISLILR